MKSKKTNPPPGPWKPLISAPDAVQQKMSNLDHPLNNVQMSALAGAHEGTGNTEPVLVQLLHVQQTLNHLCKQVLEVLADHHRRIRRAGGVPPPTPVRLFLVPP